MTIADMPPRLYWHDALRNEVETIWGENKLYGTDAHIEDLAYYATLTTFYDDSRHDIQNRRRLLYYYLGGIFEAVNKDDSQLMRHAHKLPVDSFVPKLLDNLCIAYSEPPQRTWSLKGDAHKNASEVLAGIYRDAGMDGRIAAAYKKAKLCSGVLVRFLYVNGRPRLQIIPPDLCRIETDPSDPTRLTKVVIPTTEIVRGKPETQFIVWEAGNHYRTNYKGIPIQATVEQNPYERVPFELLRLAEPDDNSTLSGGMFDVVEGCIACNAIQWGVDNGATYESWGQWVAINIGWATTPKLGPGRVTALDGVVGTGQEQAEPSLNHISTNGQYDRLHDTKLARAEALMRNAGLPDSVIKAGGGVPLSGIARVLERQELLEKRQTDLQLLAPFEQRLSDLVVAVHNVDGVAQGEPAIPIELMLSVDYAEERVYQEPDAEFKSDATRLLAGVTPPAQFYQKWSGLDHAHTDEEAVKEMMTNQSLIAPLRSMLLESVALTPAASAPPAPTQPEPNAPIDQVPQ